ncbi:hypothetical protein ACJX0J_042051, partial [Zea mays]
MREDTEIPDQELLHKAHFLILQSAEDVSNFVIGFKSGVKTRVTTLMDTLSTQREAYKDDPFILAKQANQIWNEFGLNKNVTPPTINSYYLLSANVFPIFRIESTNSVSIYRNGYTLDRFPMYSLMSFASVYIVFFDAANANIVFEYIYVQWSSSDTSGIGENSRDCLILKWAKEDAQLHPIIKKIVMTTGGWVLLKLSHY